MVSLAHGTMHALATIASAAVGVLEQNLSQRVHDGKHVKDDADQLRVPAAQLLCRWTELRACSTCVIRAPSS